MSSRILHKTKQMADFLIKYFGLKIGLIYKFKVMVIGFGTDLVSEVICESSFFKCLVVKKMDEKLPEVLKVSEYGLKNFQRIF